jgi:hypothetical protein
MVVKVVRPAMTSREAEVPCESKEKYLAIQLKVFPGELDLNAPCENIAIESNLSHEFDNSEPFDPTWVDHLSQMPQVAALAFCDLQRKLLNTKRQ